MAGHDLTKYLQEILKERGLNFTTPAELEIVRDIKETMTVVVSDYNEAMKDAEDSHACEKNYELPDGRKILIGNERFRCPEILFTPSLAGYDLEGVHKYCFDSVMRRCEAAEDAVAGLFVGGGAAATCATDAA